MRRVLVVIQTPTYGGPHNQVLRLHEPLQAHGWETEVVLPEEPGNGAERLAAAGVTVHRAPMCRLRRTVRLHEQMAQWRNAASGIRVLRSIVEERSPDVIQVCGLLTLQGACAARASGVPIVWQLLSTFAPKPLRAMVAPVVGRWAHAVMSTGIETARQHPGISPSDVISFFPPVVLREWRHDPEARVRARAALGVPADAVLVATVGNFNRQKCHETLVDVARELQETGSAAYYRLIGSATPGQREYYEREVVERASRYGLTQNGRLAFVPGDCVSWLIHAVDVFVLTSRAEGVPTALLEAMAAGIPAVSTDVGSVREAMVHGETGFLVSPRRTSDFAGCVRQLVTDAALRRRMGIEASRRAETEFSSERCADRHLQAFRLALHRASRRSVSRSLPAVP